MRTGRASRRGAVLGAIAAIGLVALVFYGLASFVVYDQVGRAPGECWPADRANTPTAYDVPARFGGEEFVVLLRNPAPGVAVEVGERIRAAVRALDLRELGVPPVSVSVGVAVAHGPDEDIGALLEIADQNLYSAKRRGRDRVVAA